jgi:dTMP kinase
VRELRILVDGVDLAGKTTLVHALVAELESRGVPAARHRGMLSPHHPLDRALRQLSSARQPDSWWTTTAYLIGGFLLDSVLVRFDPPRPRNRVLVQDAYGDRTVAFGMAGGPYIASALALRWPKALSPFDLAVYLHASPQAREARLGQGRDHLDVRDERTVHDRVFSERFHAFHVHGMGRRHERLLVLDSTSRSPEDLAREIADQVVPGPRPH